jgi:AcrR family transcriptional regulator
MTATTTDQQEGRPHRRADALRNREAVMEAAIRVLAERPQASMRDIADASGLGRTTVYRHFSTREELVAALFVRVVEESEAMMRDVAAEHEDAEAVLRHMALELVKLNDRYRFLHSHPELRDEHLHATQEDPYGTWFREAQGRGELRGDLTVEFMTAMLRGMAIATTDELLNERASPADAGRMLAELLVSAFLPRP